MKRKCITRTFDSLVHYGCHSRGLIYLTAGPSRRLYHTSDFTSGFTSSVEVNGPVQGPLGKAGVLGKGITPRSLKQFLDNYVISQSRAKRVISTAVYNHYMRVQSIRRREEENMDSLRGVRRAQTHPVEEEFPGQVVTTAHPPEQYLRENESFETPLVELQKSNCLVVGPSGTGKTLIARTLAKILDVPFSISDCTAFTQAGYVGEDVDVCVQRLLAASNWDVRRAETGIICLDEVDKIASVKTRSHGRDVSGEGVQQALLKILEGTTLQITSPKPKQSTPSPFGSGSSIQTGDGPGGKGETFTVDTSNILFILCGAFNGLDKIVLDRVSKHSMGFNAPVHPRQNEGKFLSSHLEEELQKLYGRYFAVDSGRSSTKNIKDETPGISRDRRRTNVLEFTEPRDLISFGFLPEFIGRIPILAALDIFDEETLVRVLSEPRNSLLNQYERLFEMSGVELKFTSKSLRDIARAAMKMETGARALRTFLERLLSDSMFEAPGSSIKHILVTSAVARFKQPPIYFARGQRERFHSVLATEEAEWAPSHTKDTEFTFTGENEQPEKLKANAI